VLRVCAQVLGAAEASDITWLRVLLVADVLARAAELRNLQVLTVLASDGEPTGQHAALERAAEALGIHPPAAHASPDEAQASLGGPIDVHLASSRVRADDPGSGLVALVGTAHIHEAGEAAGDLLAGHEHEPLAIRLALLSFPHHLPADLTKGVLADACATVERWRLRVAEWAELPSRPIPKQIAETVRGAFDDLDIVAALAFLEGLVSDDGLPAGAMFETLLHADRILGLDLPRDIGRAGR
jgi:hypothetical protein